MITPWHWQTQPDATEDTKSKSMSSRKTSVKKAIAKIRNMGDAAEIQCYVQGDRRAKVQRTAKACIEALSPSPQEADSGLDLNATIECLLALRSVRDQAQDALLDLSTGELGPKLDSLERSLIDHLAEQREHQEGLGLLTVSVVGDFNSGKSTFINALLGMDVCPVGDEPTTASVTRFVHGDEKRIEQEQADGTRVALDEADYRALAQHKKEGDSEPHTFRISVNSPVLDHIQLVDTPGFNAPPPNANDTRVPEEAVIESDVLFVLTDANKGNPSNTLLEQLERISQSSTNESRQPVFLLLNKAEGLPPSQRREVKRVCKERHNELFGDIVLVSALQLSEAEDEESLDALDSAMQRMRSAYKARDSFQESISAKLTAQSYQIDISGNVYDVAASSNLGLVSREQLTEMVKQVAAERHVLLEQQFGRHTLQLRADWQTTLADLEADLEKALSAFAGEGDGGDETRLRETALKATEKARSDTIQLVTEIFHDMATEIVNKNQRVERGTVYYQVRVYLDKAPDAMDQHDNWRRIFGTYQGLLSYLKQFFYINFDITPQQVVEYLKERVLDTIRESIQDMEPDFQKHQKIREGCEYVETEKGEKFWQYEYDSMFTYYKDEAEAGAEFVRNEHFDDLTSLFVSLGDNDNVLVHIQGVIDELREIVISTSEQSQAQATKRSEELRILQERINAMKEHTL